MNLWQSFLIAIGMLRLHKLRAFLTMLGVIIGVMSVTIIVMISSGFQHYMTYEFKKLGADTIMVMYDPGGQFRGPLGSIAGLENSDVDFLLERVPTLDIASALIQVPTQKVVYGNREVRNPRIFATDHNALKLNRMTLIEGRELTEADVRTRANVCVVGEEIRDTLFPDKVGVGKLLTLKGITLEVVGVLERIDMMGQTTARDVWLPLSTAQDKWLGGETVHIIETRPKPGNSVDETMDRIWQALMVKSNNRPVYRVESRESMMNIMATVIGVAGVILAAIAALSLLVGGIGIMNIMLVSVTERTKEIGLRKAVGAKSAAVLVQFLVESATLSLVGGLIGMGIAYGLGSLVTVLTISTEWPSKGGLATPFPVTAALASAAFSAFVGLVFGLYPAARAAKLSPIEALRAE
jgi:putative ABC transport system permease protein